MIFTENNLTHAVTLDKAVTQLSKGQDENYTGEFIHPDTNQLVRYAINIDGHGSNHCIQKIRETDLVPFLSKLDPISALSDYVYDSGVVPRNTCSGAVITMALIYPDRIVLYNCGDSQYIVYENDEQTYVSVPHDLECDSEKERIKTNPEYYGTDSSGKKIKLFDTNKMSPQGSKYVMYKNHMMLVPTRAIGHNNIVFHDSEIHEITLEPTKKYRILLASDGVFDMTILDNPDDANILKTGSAEDIVKFYTDRWLQEWSYYENDTDEAPFQKFSYRRSDCDDVSACVIEIVPAIPAVEV